MWGWGPFPLFQLLLCNDFLAFSRVFPSLHRDFRGSSGKNILAFFGVHILKNTREGWKFQPGTVDFKKKHPARKVGTRSRQCRPTAPGRFAFPGGWNPRICSTSRIGWKFSSNFSGSFPEFSSGTPEHTKGRKKHINFFNINFLVPSQNPHFGPPEKKKFMCLISWERTQKGNPHKLFRGDVWGPGRGPKRAVFGHKKSSLLFLSGPEHRAHAKGVVLSKRRTSAF